jgi:hypothetical protein
MFTPHLNPLTAEYFVACRLLCVGRNIQLLPNVCQNIDLIIITTKLHKFHTRIFEGKRNAVVGTIPGNPVHAGQGFDLKQIWAIPSQRYVYQFFSAVVNGQLSVQNSHNIFIERKAQLFILN